MTSDAVLHLVVTRLERERPGIVSVHLADAGGGRLPPFEGGQHLTVDLPADGHGLPLRRTYTLSGTSGDGRAYRITVKREEPGGRASRHLHDRIAVGDILACLPPRGRFVLGDGERPVVLVSAGIGITPMVAMLEQLRRTRPEREAWFLHGSRGPGPLVEEVRALMAASPHRLVLFDSSDGRTGDRHGRIDIRALREVLPFGGYDFYLCGPQSFLSDLRAGLAGLDVPPDRIHWESFGTRGPPTKQPEPETLDPPPGAGAGAAPASSHTVTFARSGVTAIVAKDGATVLDAARTAGLDAAYSCEEGVCGTCRCRCLSGEITYIRDPVAWLEEDEILPCIARPRTDLEIDM